MLGPSLVALSALWLVSEDFRSFQPSYSSTKQHDLDSGEDNDPAPNCCFVRSETQRLDCPDRTFGIDFPSLTEDQFLDSSCIFAYAITQVPYSFRSVQDTALSLIVAEHGTKGKRKLSSKPFFIDFAPSSSSSLGRRVSGRDQSKDMLVRAVKPQDSVVWDLTAGFGHDAYLIAKAGARKVLMVERNPVVFALLSDAIRRLGLLASEDADFASLHDKLSCTFGNGISVSLTVDSHEERPDVIYLDPMFPSR